MFLIKLTCGLITTTTPPLSHLRNPHQSFFVSLLSNVISGVLLSHILNQKPHSATHVYIMMMAQQHPLIIPHTPDIRQSFDLDNEQDLPLTKHVDGWWSKKQTRTNITSQSTGCGHHPYHSLCWANANNFFLEQSIKGLTNHQRVNRRIVWMDVVAWWHVPYHRTERKTSPQTSAAV